MPYYWLYDYRDLRQYLSEVINFPIKTSFENGEPRLLVVSTDVQDYTSAVTFDSYQKKKDPVDAAGNVVADRQGKISRYFAEYGRDSSTKHILLYDGIGSEQLLASALAKYALDHPHMEDKITGNDRQFWDGGYLSNTPLRELLQSHRDFWLDYSGGQGKDTKVPDLEIYVVDLHATLEKATPNDLDSIDDREHDILFHNRTQYDEKVANLVTDYVDLTRKLIALAKKKGRSDSEINNILDSNLETKSKKRSGENRSYRDLVEGRFRITKIWHIERHDEPDSIYGKFTDFSAKSIEELIRAGEHDANRTLNLGPL